MEDVFLNILAAVALACIIAGTALYYASLVVGAYTIGAWFLG